MTEVWNQEYLACWYRIYSWCHVCYGSVLSFRLCQCVPQNIHSKIPFVLVLWDLKSSVPLFHRICFGTPNVLGFYQVVKIQHSWIF